MKYNKTYRGAVYLTLQNKMNLIQKANEYLLNVNLNVLISYDPKESISIFTKLINTLALLSSKYQHNFYAEIRGFGFVSIAVTKCPTKAQFQIPVHHCGKVKAGT